MYFKLGFRFGKITPKTWHYFGDIFSKFLPVMLCMSAMEIGNFIDTSFASYLPKGSVSLIYYANRFMGIPLGVFATAFATILLPHFSRITAYAPSRLSFYLLETAKFIAWVTVPVTIIMSFFADTIFSTMFSDKFTGPQVHEAGSILIAYTVGLFFASFNKILISIYYALRNTKVPAVISGLTIISNIIFNSLLIGPLQASGLALASAISWMLQTMMFVACLHYLFNMKVYAGAFLHFGARYMLQLACIGALFFGVYKGIAWIIANYIAFASRFFLVGLGFWLWVGPLCLFFFLAMWYTRKAFGVRLYFFD
jgi:putative peptidoglycan lipid II flippase